MTLFHFVIEKIHSYKIRPSKTGYVEVMLNTFFYCCIWQFKSGDVLFVFDVLVKFSFSQPEYQQVEVCLQQVAKCDVKIKTIKQYLKSKLMDYDDDDDVLLLCCCIFYSGGTTVLTRQFVASILACSFLCLFPERTHDRASKLNSINFTHFFKLLPQ